MKRLTLKQFVEMGKFIAYVYQDDEQEQAEAVGRYIDNACRAEGR